jgi:hypothetical protein
MLELPIQTAKKYRPKPVTSYNFNKLSIRASLALISVLLFSLAAIGQTNGSIPYKSQEVSEKDGIPVLIKHLPDWESVRPRATFITDAGGLKATLAERPVLDQIDFAGGTEAVTATYPAGRLLIVEFTSPQASIDADTRIKATLPSDDSTVYRRIGNYNAFVFEVSDPLAANALLDQVKYEKTVQWLGRNPYQISPERAFVIGTTDLFISTVLIVMIGIGFSLVGGLIVGYIFFVVRDKKRSRLPTFTDAGGMTRLNLDGFTPEIDPKFLLKD